MGKNFLIVVDMQNDFIKGVLGSKDAVRAANKLVRFLKENASSYDAIYATQDKHNRKDYGNTEEERRIPRHCLDDSTGHLLDSRIHKYISESNIFEKDTFCSIWMLIELTWNYPNRLDDITFDIVGLCTDICVISNALMLRSYFPNAKIRVFADCCAGTTSEKHEAALEVMRSCLIDII